MKYLVRLFYSSYVEREEEANSEEEAIIKARNEQDRLYKSEVALYDAYLPDIVNNLEPWNEADEAELLEEESQEEEEPLED